MQWWGAAYRIVYRGDTVVWLTVRVSI